MQTSESGEVRDGEGKESLPQYCDAAWMEEKLEEAERDIAEGRVDTYENMRARIRDTYGF